MTVSHWEEPAMIRVLAFQLNCNQLTSASWNLPLIRYEGLKSEGRGPTGFFGGKNYDNNNSSAKRKGAVAARVLLTTFHQTTVSIITLNPLIIETFCCASELRIRNMKCYAAQQIKIKHSSLHQERLMANSHQSLGTGILLELSRTAIGFVIELERNHMQTGFWNQRAANPATLSTVEGKHSKVCLRRYRAKW